MSETVIIEAGRLERNYWLDLWRYRELFRVLAWRDLAVRYKQTVIGVAWSVIRPLLIVPTATVVVAFVDFLISFALLLLLMAWYQYPPDWRMLGLPGFVLLAFVASVGPALWITALNVKYRDFRYVIPFLVQFGLYVSPVGFSSSVIPEKWRLLYSLNPLVGVIDGFRWSILGQASAIYWPSFGLSFAIVACFLWRGIARFRKMERTFADLI